MLIEILDHILFKGKTHSKRGMGLSVLPEKVLKLDICKENDVKKEIRDLFVCHFREREERMGERMGERIEERME
jgi:hypothetical protein